MRAFRTTVCAAITGAALPSAVVAQDASRPAQAVTQGAQIEDAIARTTASLAPVPPSIANSDGEDGIFVVDREPVLFAAGNLSLGYAGRPLRTAEKTGGSGSVDADFSAGVRTRIAGKLDFSAFASVSGTEYFKEFGPSNTIASTNISLGMPIGRSPFYVGAVGFAGYSYDDLFRRGVKFYGGSGFVSAAIPLGPRVVVQPVASATRQKNGIAENDTTAAAARLAVIYSRGRFGASVAGGASRVWFDDFYEDVIFRSRRDWQYDAGLTLSYRLTGRLLVSTSARYVRRDSDFDLASYDAFEGRLAVSVATRF